MFKPFYFWYRRIQAHYYTDYLQAHPNFPAFLLPFFKSYHEVLEKRKIIMIIHQDKVSIHVPVSQPHCGGSKTRSRYMFLTERFVSEYLWQKK
jgi:hypothetical protein